MASSSKRRQDEKHLKILREIGSQSSNRICFDCLQKGPTYINMTIGSFVCTTCSGHLRGLNPPHRVKSISMASFTIEEVEQIKSKGNQYCKTLWLGLFDEKSNFYPETKDEQKILEFMIAKYEKKRFFLEPHMASKNLGNQVKETLITAPTIVNRNEPVKSAFKIPAPVSNVTRASIAFNSTLSPSSNGISSKPIVKSSSVDLLSGIKSASEHLEKKNAPVSSHSFESPSSSPSAPCLSFGQNGNFANFENANIFSNTQSAAVKSSSIPFSLSSNPLTPFSSSTNTLNFTIPLSSNNTAVIPASTDRYAALKDLDEAFKFQKGKDSSRDNVVSDSNYNHQSTGQSILQNLKTTPLGGTANWANFDTQINSQNFNGKTLQNPWLNNSNPFASSQLPLRGTSYNPFL